MKLLAYLTIFLALCCSTRCWSMYGGYYGRPGAPVGKPMAPAAGAKVMTQQEYQAYLAQQAQQRAGGAASASTQPQAQKAAPVAQPAAPAQAAQASAREPKVRFSEQPTTKVGEKYPGEIAQEEAVAASVEQIADEDELAKRKRTAIRESKWSSPNDQVAAEEEFEKEHAAGTAEARNTMGRKERKRIQQEHMKELGIPIEKPKGSIW